MLKKFSWEQFRHLMDRIAARLDASNQVLGQYMTFARKAIDEINRLHQNAELNHGVSPVENEDDEQVGEVYMWKGSNLLALGGSTYRERAMAIANKMWTEEERLKFCIEPKKALTGDRQPADEERTQVSREVMAKVMKHDFLEEKYRSILKYVNQQGVDFMRKKRRSEQKENENPNEETTGQS